MRSTTTRREDGGGHTYVVIFSTVSQEVKGASENCWLRRSLPLSGSRTLTLSLPWVHSPLSYRLGRIVASSLIEQKIGSFCGSPVSAKSRPIHVFSLAAKYAWPP